jgi:multimeric flavodoxin WrbA
LSGETPKEVKDKKQFPGFSGFDYTKPNGNYINDTGRLNILGISCTNMPLDYTVNRSTSEMSLVRALNHAKTAHNCNTVHVKLRELEFGFCEGYYSSNKKACEWPCAVSDRDGDKDKMDVIYYGLTEWADIMVVSTPIRYGNPTALYFKMVERLNTIHNQVTLHDKHLIKDKVACFLITGGQDNVQHTAGEMITFFSEMGFMMPRYSYAAWTRGWYAEHMAKSFDLCMTNKEFANDIMRVIDTAVDLKRRLNATKSNLSFDKDNVYHDAYEKISYEQYDPSEMNVKKTTVN